MKRILTIVMAMILAVSVVGLAGCKKEEEKKDGGLGNAKEGKLVVAPKIGRASCRERV